MDETASPSSRLHGVGALSVAGRKLAVGEVVVVTVALFLGAATDWAVKSSATTPGSSGTIGVTVVVGGLVVANTMVGGLYVILALANAARAAYFVGIFLAALDIGTGLAVVVAPGYGQAKQSSGFVHVTLDAPSGTTLTGPVTCSTQDNASYFDTVSGDIAKLGTRTIAFLMARGTQEAGVEFNLGYRPGEAPAAYTSYAGELTDESGVSSDGRRGSARFAADLRDGGPAQLLGYIRNLSGSIEWACGEPRPGWAPGPSGH